MTTRPTRRRTIAGAIAACLAFAAPLPASAQQAGDTLGRILREGVLKVGVRADYRPWGFRNPAGEFVGMEIEMAKDVAATLGVRPEFVPVVAANRMQFLAQGQIDLMIATMSDTAERRRVVGIVHPNYYSSGFNVLLPKQVTTSDWNALRGRQLCAIQGAWYNRPATERYGVEILAFTGIAEVETALRQRRCVGWLYDDNLIAVMLASGQWNDFHMPLPSQSDTPWGLAVRLDDLDKPWGRFMSGMVAYWHRSGKLLAWEKEAGIAESAFLRRMHEALKDHIQ
ncbi:transporter substrate-binding domain-containing protein [Elioraea sp. Yellowstone]|jgi:polar amino acid transport system substrate-binding protein|uniref:transporter substrate-binding domain-containing protein n=1 Tax=Elioraea sp. Yellowstone TaxID=2592070 RepID=UPI001150A261|nr:transporter substrate-binding domain-containing protein [Elioraea sp. Yellowstone]TQF76531.1 transporter substrate-binding domain-containing protein [Elioraea sp. Yellowstone]